MAKTFHNRDDYQDKDLPKKGGQKMRALIGKEIQEERGSSG